MCQGQGEGCGEAVPVEEREELVTAEDSSVPRGVTVD